MCWQTLSRIGGAARFCTPGWNGWKFVLQGRQEFAIEDVWASQWRAKWVSEKWPALCWQKTSLAVLLGTDCMSVFPSPILLSTDVGQRSSLVTSWPPRQPPLTENAKPSWKPMCSDRRRPTWVFQAPHPQSKTALERRLGCRGHFSDTPHSLNCKFRIPASHPIPTWCAEPGHSTLNVGQHIRNF